VLVSHVLVLASLDRDSIWVGSGTSQTGLTGGRIMHQTLRASLVFFLSKWCCQQSAAAGRTWPDKLRREIQVLKVGSHDSGAFIGCAREVQVGRQPCASGQAPLSSRQVTKSS
jgi:hypothetical protein